MKPKDYFGAVQISRPGEVREGIGEWLRLKRQQQELTLPIMASRSGVPVSTLSRLEREGQGSVETLLRVFQALGVLDEINRTLREQLKLVSLPATIEELAHQPQRRQRVRPRKHKEGKP